MPIPNVYTALSMEEQVKLQRLVRLMHASISNLMTEEQLDAKVPALGGQTTREVLQEYAVRLPNG